eukprot:Skav203784  [mRNA]  locus=scaffold206:391587:395610:+ [translate_table: standard]
MRRRMLAFEVMYFFRQFPKARDALSWVCWEQAREPGYQPGEKLPGVAASIAPVLSVHGSDWGAGSNESCRDDEGDSALVEMASALTIQVALVFVPELSQLCGRLPAWATYISAHGLYWCGRVLALNQRDAEAFLGQRLPGPSCSQRPELAPGSSFRFFRNCNPSRRKQK